MNEEPQNQYLENVLDLLKGIELGNLDKIAHSNSKIVALVIDGIAPLDSETDLAREFVNEMSDKLHW